MRWLKRLFGERSKTAPLSQETAEDMRADPDLIRVFDEYGREMFIDKETWRKDVLPNTLRDRWDSPDGLYTVLVGALEDGFHADVLEAAERLQEIDPDRTRSSCVLGIALMKSGRLDQAERVLTSCMEKHGEKGVLLTNLAKVFAARGNQKRADGVLWHALEVDPNQDGAVVWWAAIHRERSGEAGYVDALRKAARVEGSWRPQLWLARVALERKEFAKAHEYYEGILASFESMPADVMMHMSGDLGRAGRIADVVDLLGSRFDAAQHGLPVGNNLIAAYCQLKDLENARRILEQLYALNRPDWRERLAYWEDEIDQRSDKYGPVTSDKEIAVGGLILEWPVWCHKLKGLEALLPPKEQNSPCFAFVACSYDLPSPPEQVLRQREDTEGALGRAIPLFLAEQIHMLTTGRAVMVLPVIVGKGAFAVVGSPWEPAALKKMLGDVRADFLVNAHLDATAVPWQITLTLISVSDSSRVDRMVCSINPENPGPDVLKMSQKVRRMAEERGGVKRSSPPIDYHFPPGPSFNMFLSGLSRSLNLSAATSSEVGLGILYGERGTLDYLLNLALENPHSDVSCLMFIGALAKNRAYGSKVCLDYRKKAEKLLREHTLSGRAGEVAKKTMQALYADQAYSGEGQRADQADKEEH